MTHFLKTLILLLLFVPLESYSLTGIILPQKKDIPIKKKDKVRPRDKEYLGEVSAFIQNDEIHIIFDEPEGMATVLQIENGMTTLSRQYISTLSEAQVPLVYSDYPIQLIIKTSYGNEYEGWIIPDNPEEP